MPVEALGSPSAPGVRQGRVEPARGVRFHTASGASRAGFRPGPAPSGRLLAVPLLRLSSTDAFVVTDLEGAARADGVLRWARKVLVDGARTMARSRTYSWALLGEPVSGASAGISASPEDRAAAIAAATTELSDSVAAGRLSLDAGKGLSPTDLAPLDAVDTRSPLLRSATATGTLADALLAAGIAGAAGAAAGGLDGRTVAVEGAGAAGPAIVEAFAGHGARVAAIGTASGTLVVREDDDTEELASAWAEHGEGLPAVRGSDLPVAAVLEHPADVLVCGSKLGLVDHDVAGRLPQRVLAPCGAAPVTARGLATARRRDVVVLPDFLTTLGPLLAFHPDDSATAGSLLGAAGDRTATLAAEVLDHEEGPYLGACLLAEGFLTTWQETLPFGRPLA